VWVVHDIKDGEISWQGQTEHPEIEGEMLGILLQKQHLQEEGNLLGHRACSR
jgi:hypothetical protein